MSDIYNYHLGIDLGVGSLSFTIRKEYLDSKGNVVKNEILPPYVETYDLGTSKDRRKKRSPAEYRRNKRSSSRVTKRRWNRVQDLCKIFNITHGELVQFQTKNQENHAPYLRYESLKHNKILTRMEILACLVQYAKYRNYSNSFDTSDSGKSEYKGCVGKGDELVKKHKYPTIAWLEDAIFVRPGTKQRNWKNTKDQLKVLFEREHWKEEANELLNINKEALPCSPEKILDVIYSQRYSEVGPGKGSDIESVKAYRESKSSSSKSLSYLEKNALHNHTSFTERIGNCTYYRNEKKVPKIHPLNVRFVIINELIKITKDLTSALELLDFNNSTIESIEIIQKIYRDFVNVTCSYAHKSIGVNFLMKYQWFKDLKRDHRDTEEYIRLVSWFNGDIIKPNINKNIIKVTQILNILKDLYVSKRLKISNKQEEKLINILYRYFTPALRVNKLVTECQFLNNDEEIISLLKSINASGTAHFGTRALKEQVDIFEKAELSFEKLYLYRIEKSKQAEKDSCFHIQRSLDRLEEHTNPIVFSAISRIKKHIQTLLEKGFFFDSINIEIGTELSLSKEAKSDLTRIQNKRRDERIKIKERLKELGQSDSSKSIDRYICWKQQGGRCIYSGEEIKEENICSNKYELDHIIPESVLPIDALENRVLVQEQENRKKKDNAPLGYLNEMDKKNYYLRVEKMKDNFHTKDSKKKIDPRARDEDLYFVNQRKLDFLLCGNDEMEEKASGFLTRDLNNTRYLSKSIVSYLKACIRTDEGEKVQFFHKKDSSQKVKVTRISSVNGQITSLLRRNMFKGTIWGEEKLRSVTDWHHGIDSICISFCSTSDVQKARDRLLMIKTICLINQKSTTLQKKALWNRMQHYFEERNSALKKLNQKYENDGKKIRIPTIKYGNWNINNLLNDLIDKQSISLSKLFNVNINDVLNTIPIKLRIEGYSNVNDIPKEDFNNHIFLDSYKCSKDVWNNINHKARKKIPLNFVNSDKIVSKKKVEKLTNNKAEWKIMSIQDGKVVEQDAIANETSFYCPLKGTKILRKIQYIDGLSTPTISYMEIGINDRNILGIKNDRLHHLKAITALQSIEAVKVLQKNRGKVLKNYFQVLKEEYTNRGYSRVTFIKNGDIVTIKKNNNNRVFLFKVSQIANGKIFGSYPGYKQLNFEMLDNHLKGYIKISSVGEITPYHSTFFSKITK